MTAEEWAKQATITWDNFLDRVAAGRYTDTQLTATKWYRAGAELEKIRVGGVGPTPPPSTLTPYQSIIFAGQNPLDGLGAPAYYKVAFTADPAYDSYATKGAADALRGAGHDIYVWYVPTQVPKARADEVAQRLGATHVLGQCESADEFAVSQQHGRTAMVGNLSALVTGQLAMVARADAIVVNENYRGCGAGAPDWRNANAGVPGNCLACYQDGDCRRIPLAEQVANGWFVPHRDSLYGPGLTVDDYATLRGLG